VQFIFDNWYYILSLIIDNFNVIIVVLNGILCFVIELLGIHRLYLDLYDLEWYEMNVLNTV